MTATRHLDQILLDSSTSLQQKTDCLKLLKIVVKNLSDPAKAHDAKYRQLKLDNDKVRAKLLSCAAAVPYLQALGFVETNNDIDGRAIRLEEPVDAALMKAAADEIIATLEQLEVSNRQNKKPQVNQTTTSSTTSAMDNLSEKQKARRIMEEKERMEREKAKDHRKLNVALLKQDKYVRENDENWTSGVSAACAKAGNSISTFRDKYGEN